MLRTLNYVDDSWARVISENRLACMNLAESRHQVVRFVSREAIIESVDLQVIVVVVRAALEPSLRRLNVLS